MTDDSRLGVVAYARGLAGLGARPATRAAYQALLRCPEGLVDKPSCEMTQLAILRRFLAHPLLDRDIISGLEGEWLLRIAQDAGAARQHLGDLELGDIVLRSNPEHALMVVDASAEELGLVGGLEGGRRDGQGYGLIELVEHQVDGELVDGRPVEWVFDLGRMLAAFSR